MEITWLYYLGTAILKLQGFLDSLAYGLTPTVIARWKSFFNGEIIDKKEPLIESKSTTNLIVRVSNRVSSSRPTSEFSLRESFFNGEVFDTREPLLESSRSTNSIVRVSNRLSSSHPTSEFS